MYQLASVRSLIDCSRDHASTTEEIQRKQWIRVLQQSRAVGKVKCRVAVVIGGRGVDANLRILQLPTGTEGCLEDRRMRGVSELCEETSWRGAIPVGPRGGFGVNREVAGEISGMADRRDWGGGGDDPEESTQRMIERIWESLTDIRARMDQQAPVPPVAVPPGDGEAIPVAPVPPRVEVPFAAPVPPPPPVLIAEEPVMQVEKFLRLGLRVELQDAIVPLMCKTVEEAAQRAATLERSIRTRQVGESGSSSFRLPQQSVGASKGKAPAGPSSSGFGKWGQKLKQAFKGKGRGWGGRPQFQQGQGRPEVEESQQSTARQPIVPPGVAVVISGRGVDANLRILQILKGAWRIVERVALPNCARKRRGVVQFPWDLAEGSV
ncbi:hypothetical protein Taro_038263 [Colocasia esculenta]|uniref:Uncharacterized protein n=1 Tax=Colocasia esculenta TaxID=4460 RepID=A0A843W7Q8_COLES|nr:hypothetical protein [Colocasia esculenta]